MQSATSRLNNIIMFGASVLLVMAILNHFHGRFLIYNPTPQIQFSISQVNQFRNTTKWQQFSFKYNLTANLSSLYTWNLKQLYAYIEVAWFNQKNQSNRMIVSDWILQSPNNRTEIAQQFYIQAKNASLDYTVRDVHRMLRGKTLNLTISVQYMPIVGFFFKTQLYNTTLKLPSNYI